MYVLRGEAYIDRNCRFTLAFPGSAQDIAGLEEFRLAPTKRLIIDVENEDATVLVAMVRERAELKRATPLLHV